MNIFLWILQVFFAAHTIMGAVWKWSNAEQAVPSLKALPHSFWLALSVLEIIAAVVLLLPLVNKRWGHLVPWASLFITAEMLLFVIVHLVSGDQNYGPVFYWLVVAALAAFLAYGRKILRPLHP